MAKRKIVVSTDNSDWKAPKLRKPRKPMSEEQRAAAAERLAKVREKKREVDPDYGKAGLHVSLRDLPKDHNLHPDKVKEWIKIQKDIVKTERGAVRAKVKGAIAKLATAEGYIRSMQKYLRTGDWDNLFYGPHEEKRVTYTCKALGYYWYGPKKGLPKRDVHTYYPDLGVVWTKEMDEEDV